MTIDVDYTTEHPLRPLTALEKLRLIGEIATTYGRARWWLRSGTVEQAARRARRGGPAGAADQRPVETFVYALRVGQLVERGLRRLPGDTRCLTRSMVLVRLLSRRGIFSCDSGWTRLRAFPGERKALESVAYEGVCNLGAMTASAAAVVVNW